MLFSKYIKNIAGLSFGFNFGLLIVLTTNNNTYDNSMGWG